MNLPYGLWLDLNLGMSVLQAWSMRRNQARND